MPQGIDIEDLTENSVYVKYEDGEFVWQEDIMRQFKLKLDAPPAEEVLTELMHTVGKAGLESNRVEVPFESIAPANDSEYWSLDNNKELTVAIGRSGATRLQRLGLGKGVAQHMLIAGKTGSGIDILE